MSFFWDFVVSIALFLVLVGSFLSVFSLSSKSLHESLVYAEKERNVLFKADFLLKNCFPQGIAYCDDGFLYSHIAHSQANLSFQGSFCIKRLVLQDEETRFLRVCS